MKTLFAKDALLAADWRQDVSVEIDDKGLIRKVTANRPCETGAERLTGPMIPGMPNVHSHVWQRGFAGRTEVRGDFWAWRNTMYRFAQGFDPENLYTIATQTYRDMLKAGYTWVGEFHYLHHTPNGSPYDNPAEMSEQVIQAALDVGIGITHLPVLYGYSNFGSQPAESGQRRFVHDADGFLRLLDALHSKYASNPQVRIGCAPHSLRAVDPGLLSDVLANAVGPKHIHIAEQPKEVTDCVDWCGMRPVEWLMGNIAVDSSWCLVHATHVSVAELRSIAASGAVVGLCPTTEANLGDGVFSAEQFLQLGGNFAIGSDSQVSIDPAEELRLLEYSQRLTQRRRGILASENQPSVGEHLFSRAQAGGASALGREPQGIEVGASADLIVLDGNSPLLDDKQGHEIMDTWIFSGGSSLVTDVMTQGQWRVRRDDT